MTSYSEIFSNTWAIILVLLFFGGSIFVHEFGHFLAAKARGLKVLRFSIGFGPKIFAWEGRDGCKYMVSLLPFGGYVALPQLADMGALEGGDELKITHEDIAKDAGTAREVVTRILKQFQADGLVKLTRGKVTVLEAGKLGKI